jgi:hypothetical protein
MELDAKASASSSEQAIDFKVTADSGPGSFKEKGTWSLGVNGKGKVSLRGTSTASLNEPSETWRAKCRWELQGAQDSSVGPVPVNMVKKILTPPRASMVQASSTGCGSMYSQTSSGLFIAGALFSFCTPASAVLNIAAVSTSIAGSSKGNSCLSSQLDNINQQLATQAYEIQQIQTYLGLATNVFYNAWYLAQVGLTESNVKSWREKLSMISPVGAQPNAFGSFMSTGLGLWAADLQPQPGAITDPQQLAVSLTTSQMNTLSSQISSGEINGFQSWVDDFSGTKAVYPDPTNCGAACLATVVQDPDSYLIKVYEDLFGSLQDNINDYVPQAQAYNQVANSNVVPLYDQYNTMLVNFYQQAVVGLQQALTMEWLVNEMNYFRAASGTTGDQLNSWGEVNGTLYKWSGKSPTDEGAAYNTAQQNLAQFYAARFNQLYLNTLNYIVSDVPVTPQAYPNDPITYTIRGTPYSDTPVAYGGEVGAGAVAPTPTPAPGATPAPTPATPDQGDTPLSLLPTALFNGTTWQSAAALYQFSGLYDVSKCISSLEAYNQAAGSDGGTMQEWLQDPTNCPPILVLSDGTPLNQGFYDGNTLAPYTSYQAATGKTGGPMVLAGTMTNNLKFCDRMNPAPGWYAPSGSFVGNAAGLVAGQAYLNCGRWYLPGGSSSCGFPRANCAPDPSDVYTDFGEYPEVYSVAAGQGCTNNLKINGDKYPWILTLTDSFPSDMKSCSAVIMSATSAGTTVSPTYTEARSESGSFWSGSSTGCSIGFIGDGISNKLPGFRPCGNGAECLYPDIANFGMRLMNVTNSGNQGNASGWVLPVQVQASCGTSTPITKIFAWGPTNTPTITERGYLCNGANPYNQLVCTILDGTQYVFELSYGSSANLVVQALQP